MELGFTRRRTVAWSRHLALAAAVAGFAALAGCGGNESGGASTTSPPTGGEWSAPNADVRNTRHVGGPIDTASVSRLRVAWKRPIKASGYVATPVISGGVAYTQDLDSNVEAIDMKSGRVLWTKAYGDTNVGPNGVAVGGGRVYGATNANAFALDAKTGKELWSKPVTRNPAEAVDMAPGYHDGTVFVSPAVRQPGSAGVLWALDAASGRTRWKWAEVPAGLWGHPEVNSGGGLWHPPSFDDRGGLYIGIANPLPFAGTEEAPWGQSRPGPNRWSNSIVKLDERTGALVWGRQVLPHDIYDWDLECPVILVRAGRREIALAAGKMGFVYAFDATTGAPLWKRSVGLHNGHDDDNLLALHGRYARLRFPAKILPGDWGGVQTPMASDGTTVYVPVNNLYVLYRSQTDMEQQDLMEGTGEIVALDVRTGRVRWDRKLPHSVYGAASVANDVVFTTTYDGTVWGLGARTGATAWRAKLPAGTDTPVAVSGDTILTAGSLPLEEEEERLAIVAYRLGASRR